MSKSAAAQIEEKLQLAASLIRECEQIALAAEIDFTYELPTGRCLTFDGSGNPIYQWNNSDCVIPTGWNHSQC